MKQSRFFRGRRDATGFYAASVADWLSSRPGRTARSRPSRKTPCAKRSPASAERWSSSSGDGRERCEWRSNAPRTRTMRGFVTGNEHHRPGIRERSSRNHDGSVPFGFWSTVARSDNRRDTGPRRASRRFLPQPAETSWRDRWIRSQAVSSCAPRPIRTGDLQIRSHSARRAVSTTCRSWVRMGLHGGCNTAWALRHRAVRFTPRVDRCGSPVTETWHDEVQLLGRDPFEQPRSEASLGDGGAYGPPDVTRAAPKDAFSAAGRRRRQWRPERRRRRAAVEARQAGRRIRSGTRRGRAAPICRPTRSARR